MSRVGEFGGRLYRGDVSFNFVGRRRLWYTVSAALLLISALAVIVRGLDFGVEFTGGSVFTFQSPQASVSEVRETTESAVDVDRVTVQEVSGDRWRVQTESLQPEQVNAVQTTLAEEYGLQPQAVSPQIIGPSWGDQISQKAGIGLGVFLGLVVLYLSIIFEWKMAVPAIVALLHDVAITIGVYALVGFEVTPATVIGLLTILGFSLYDTVVVFDKVRENTVGLVASSRMTLTQAANLAVNQVLIRAINTSVIAVLPVAGILFVGAGLLGAGVLKDLALVLFVGIIAGVFSSIFVATPVFTEFKEREPQMQALTKRVAARQSGKGRTRTSSAPPADADSAAQEQEGTAAGADDGSSPAAAGVSAVVRQTRVVQEGPRQQPRKSSKKRSGGKKRR